MKRIQAKEEVCIACGLCQVYCLVEHSKSKDIMKAYKKESPRPLSRIQVQKNGSFSFALTCRHCPEPVCVFSCLTGALQRNPVSGIVTIDEQKCIGCWTCVAICPYGGIAPDYQRKKAVKCDFCPHLKEPACVANCPNQALLLTEVSAT
jgi:carbon-monoxide dehydrogenase iron sulfur subunit